jgi:hypothetical protein
VLVVIRVGPGVEISALATLVNDNRIAVLVSLDHALEVKILSETGRALIGGVREYHGPAQTARDLVYGVSHHRHRRKMVFV